MHVGKRVSGIFAARISGSWKQAALAGLLALALVTFGARSASATVIDCTNGSPGPNMTIQIFNNSAGFNIYPVLFAGGASAFDQWMEACFRLRPNQIPNPNNLYPRDSQYRMYINCCATSENGIPPGGSVTITLPFYSPLVQTISPTGTAQFIDWWQGGGINLFAAPISTGAPPAILQNHWTDDTNNNRSVTPNRNPPTCSTAGCALHLFRTPTSIGNWEPQQLIEYTLAAAGPNGAADPNSPNFDPNATAFLWVPDNVDYDLSYVNYAYMPAAIEPYGNLLNGTCCAVGWVGSVDKIQATFKAINAWLTSSLGTGWPLYVVQPPTIDPITQNPVTVPNKIPSALEIFLNTGSFNDNSTFFPAPSQSPQIIRMMSLWHDCAGQNKPYAICPGIRDAAGLLSANYARYVWTYNNDRPTWTGPWKCTSPPVSMSLSLVLSHLYGWSPFNADSGCAAEVNLLADTPGYTSTQPPNYTSVKTEFDGLQYWQDVLHRQYGQWDNTSLPSYGQFDPYVALVHGPDYMDAQFAYAYSVDDALGNMQTDGTGLIIAVGGSQNLPNPAHVTREVHFNFGPKSPYAGGVTMKGYLRCRDSGQPEDVVPSFASFVVPTGIDGQSNSIENCHIYMGDSFGRSYTMRLKGFPTNFPTPIPNQTRTTDCGKNPIPCPDPWPNAAQIQQVNQQFIDCSGNEANQDVLLSWCGLIYVYQQKNLADKHLPTEYFVILPGPAPCDRTPNACNK